MIQKIRIKLPLFLEFLFGVLLFLMFVPYQGILADGNIYLLQAVNHVFPERFATDIVFMFGNQDSFSLFTPLYVAFIKLLGVEFGTKALVFSLLCLEACALIAVIQKLSEQVSGRHLVIPFLVLILLTFDSYRYFVLGFLEIFEPAAIARQPSQIFFLFGLAFLGKRWSSLGLFLIATLFHPLNAGWGLAIWLFYHYPKCIRFVVGLCLLVPLTVFVGHGRFAAIDDYWMNYGGGATFALNDYARILLYGAILYAFYRSKTCNASLKRVIIGIGVTAFIAYYFAIMGVYLKHIFLFQVQPARFEWILAIAGKLAFGLLLFDYAKKDREERNPLCSRHFSFVFLAFALIHPEMYPVSLIGIALLILPSFTLPLKAKWPLLGMLCLAFVAYYVSAMLYDYSVTNKVAMSLWLGEAELKMLIPVVGFMALMFFLYGTIDFAQKPIMERSFWNSRNAALIVFGVATLCPESLALLVGIALILMPEFSLRNKKYRLMVGLVVILCLLDAFSASFLFSRFTTLKYSLQCLLALASLTYVLWPANQSWKWGMAFWGVLVIVALGFVFTHWDARNPDRIASEKQMGAFWENPLFPEIKDRGRAFYSVDGPKKKLSRVQFLTGNYVDYNSDGGALFYREQYVEFRRRSLWVKCGAKVDQDCGGGSFGGFIDNGLGLPGYLKQRTDLLCNANEIDYVVTDVGTLPYPRLNQTWLEYQKKSVYLYECPERS